MKCFNYKVYRDDKLIIKNSIHRETREEAYNDLEETYKGCTIKLVEVSPASAWGC